MSYPTSPPLMPPPGWYPDPEMAWTWRWWDGSRWTDLRAPQTVPPERDPYSVSSWFEQSVEASKRVIVRVGFVVLALWCVTAVLLGVFAFSVFNSGKGRELRELIQFDRLVDGNTVELTDAEWDRVGELFGDIARAAVPWMAVLFVVVLLVSTWAAALAARVADRVGSSTVESVARPADTTDALRRVPAVVAAVVVVSVVAAGVVAISLLPLFVAVAVDASGGTIAVTAVFGSMAAAVLASWMVVRLSLCVVLAAVGDWGIGIRRSWALTHAHFWGVVGRLLVAGFIAGAASFPLSFVNSFGLSFGFTTWLLSFLALQAIGNAVSTVVTVPAQVVLVRHLSGRHGNGRLGG